MFSPPQEVKHKSLYFSFFNMTECKNHALQVPPIQNLRKVSYGFVRACGRYLQCTIFCPVMHEIIWGLIMTHFWANKLDPKQCCLPCFNLFSFSPRPGLAHNQPHVPKACTTRSTNNGKILATEHE